MTKEISHQLYSDELGYINQPKPGAFGKEADILGTTIIVPRGVLLELGSEVFEGTGKLLMDTLDHLETIGDDFERHYRTILIGDNRTSGNSALIAYLEAHDLLRPIFKVMTYNSIASFLEKQGISVASEAVARVWGMTFELPVKDELYVVFQLPKQLAYWWDKGVGYWGEKGIDVQGQVVEWGRHYRELLPLVWDANDEEGTPFLIERLNANGHHDPQSFYYIWRFFTTEKSDSEKRHLDQSDGEPILEMLFETMKQLKCNRYSSSRGRL